MLVWWRWVSDGNVSFLFSSLFQTLWRDSSFSKSSFHVTPCPFSQRFPTLICFVSSQNLFSVFHLIELMGGCGGCNIPLLTGFVFRENIKWVFHDSRPKIFKFGHYFLTLWYFWRDSIFSYIWCNITALQFRKCNPGGTSILLPKALII